MDERDMKRGKRIEKEMEGWGIGIKNVIFMEFLGIVILCLFVFMCIYFYCIYFFCLSYLISTSKSVLLFIVAFYN
jgi:hypothetical protein